MGDFASSWENKTKTDNAEDIEGMAVSGAWVSKMISQAPSPPQRLCHLLTTYYLAGAVHSSTQFQECAVIPVLITLRKWSVHDGRALASCHPANEKATYLLGSTSDGSINWLPATHVILELQSRPNPHG